MGARGGGRAASAWVGLLLAMLLFSGGFVPAVAVGEAEEGQEALEEVLYLMKRPGQDPEFNVSTYAPSAGTSTKVEEGDPSGGFGLEVLWGWFLPEAPVNWSVAAGDQWNVFLFVSGWDEHLPIANFFSDPNTLGEHRVQANLSSTGSSIASGTTYLEPDLLEDGVKPVKVSLVFGEPYELSDEENARMLLLELSITGRRTSADATMDLHFGSMDHPASIEAPGYPVEALRAWEDRFLWEQFCIERQMEQKQCEENQNGPPPINGDNEGIGTPPIDNTDDENVSAPGPTLLMVLSFSIGALVFFARLRRCGDKGSFRP